MERYWYQLDRQSSILMVELLMIELKILIAEQWTVNLPLHTFSLDSTAIGVLIGIVGALFSGAIFFSYQHCKIRLQESPGARLNAARSLVSPTPWRAYVIRLRNTLDYLDRWMGRLDQPDKLFGWCLKLAFIYPFSFFLIGWLFGGPEGFGATQILPNAGSLTLTDRSAIIIIFFILSFTLLTYFNNSEIISNKIIYETRKILKRKDFYSLAKLVNLPPLIIAIILFVIMYPSTEMIGITAVACFLIAFTRYETEAGTKALGLAGAAALGGIGALALKQSGAEAAAAAVAGAATAALVGAAVLSFATFFAFAAVTFVSRVLGRFGEGVVILALAGTFILWISGTPLDDVQITTLLLFWAIMPTINAIYDCSSWWVSRCLGRNLVEVIDGTNTTSIKRFGVFIRDILIDLIVALFLLVMLAWTIPRTINLWNEFVVWVTKGEAPLELADYLCTAAKAPLTDGLWATGMLFSTLIPTAAHLTLLLLAFILWPFQPRSLDHQRAAHILENRRPPAADLQGLGEEARAKTWPEPAPSSYAIPNDINNSKLDVYGGSLNPDTVNALSWKLGVRRPAYYLLAFAGICALLYTAIGTAFASWHPLPQILLMIAGFTRGEADSCLGL